MATKTSTTRTRRNRTAVAAPAPTPVEVEPAVVESVADVAPAPADAPKKEKAAPLTLSQRRALLRLQQYDGWHPTTGFAALPFEHLADHGLADRVGDGGFKVTAKGRARTINPGYANWSAGETVAGDPSRPVHGTTRLAKAVAQATPPPTA